MKPARIIVLAHRGRRRRHRRLARGPLRQHRRADAGAGRPDRNRRRAGRRQRHRHGHTRSSPSDLRWQTWPAAAASPTFIRKSDRPDAINQLAGAIVRAPFSAGEPIREAKLIKGKRLRLHGRDPADRHARDLDRDLGRDRRRRLHPAQRSRRRHPVAPRPATPKRPPASRSTPAKRSSRTCACSQSTRRSRRRTASAWWSARPRRSSSAPRQAETLARVAPARHAVAGVAQPGRFRRRAADGVDDDRRPRAA